VSFFISSGAGRGGGGGERGAGAGEGREGGHYDSTYNDFPHNDSL
jgi:hypothetical protein